MKKLVVILLSFYINLLHAEVQDKFKISLGAMHVVNFESEMQIAPKGIPVGVRINTKDQLNMKNDTNVFRVDGYYRFNDTHSIDFSYFSVNSNGETTDSITWDGNINISGNIASYFNMHIYKVDYAYSFYHNEKVELALTLGLHITQVDLGILAYGTINGVTNSSYKSDTTVTVPLPVIGFKGEYTIIDKKLFVNYKADYLYLEFDNYKGALVTSAINLEYHFVDNFGTGIGFNANNIRVEADGDNARADVKNVLSGVVVYFSYIY